MKMTRRQAVSIKFATIVAFFSLAVLAGISRLDAEEQPVAIVAARISGHVHPSICRTKDGTLVVVYKGANILMRARSMDSGQTWEQPEPIATSARRPDAI